MRIVSLLPSATEIICCLGLRESLVGVTHECDYPRDVIELPKVTRTLIPHDATSHEIDELVRQQLQTEKALYSLDMEVLHSVRPDLIVTQALCDVCAVAESAVQAAACSLPGQPRVVNLEPTCLEDVFQCISLVGRAAGRESDADHYLASLRSRVDAVARRSESVAERPSVMLLEWIDPPFSAGHWSPELVEIAGGREIIGVAGERSVTTPWERIVAADPDVIVLACCGFDVDRTLQDMPILKSYPGWSDLRCVRSGRVYVVDGSAYFSRPGPRLVDSLELIAHALHPTVHPLPPGLPAAYRIPNLL
ncbi:cobalamin-binding protein [Stieleria varia]|uniref:Corrinoid ABC transporter substrate-binding protein n=1 Tax=Stieleria varia TaxID=2528005 RepID=A0A5C5ZQD3_9BACT|nr:cobalamin-binding protein [Stieleria varia]TWT89460.1 corrinoid ABC transporter substrate-binding protein [Stieleria varia]